MNRIWLLLLLLAMLCACSETKLSTEETMLRNGNWQYTIDGCTYTISFDSDSFSASCSCRAHMQEAALAETYRYDSETHTVSLLDSDEKIVENGNVIYIDDFYLVIKLWNQTYVYGNQNKNLPSELPDVKQMSACLTVLSIQDGVITVSDCNYDKDAADSFRTGTLQTAQSLYISGTDVVIENGNVVSSISNEIPANELEYYMYSSAYLHFDENGNVDRIDFYGQTTIS